MTIDEAITDLECLAQSETAGLDDEEREAIKMGIEALGRIKGARLDPYSRQQQLLPGETKD